MALNAQEVIIGPAFVTLGGVELGLTTDDGVTISPEFTNIELEAAQTVVIPRVHRQRVKAMSSATFYQLTLEKYRLLCDIKNAPDGGTLIGSWDARPTEFPLVITGPGSNGSTRVYTATAVLMTPPETIFNNGAYTGAPVEWQLLGDPTTNKLYTLVETASSEVVPNPASFQKIVGTTETTITNGANEVESAASIQVTFPVGIRPDQLNPSNFILRLAAASTALPAAIRYGTTGGAIDYGKVVVDPVANFSAGVDVELIVAPGILSFDGVRSTAATIFAFTAET